MPLIRLNEEYLADLGGVGFGMLDGDRTIRCLVTYEAITDAMGGNPSQNDQVQWFVHNRSDVEQVASAMFDDGAVSQPELQVGTRNLNPHLFR